MGTKWKVVGSNPVGDITLYKSQSLILFKEKYRNENNIISMLPFEIFDDKNDFTAGK